MPPDAVQVFENTTELGEDRVPASAPSHEFLADLGNHLNIGEHQKPSVFTEACNDLCRFGYDHPDVVGTTSVLQSLLSALSYKPDHDDEDTGVTQPLSGLSCACYRFHGKLCYHIRSIAHLVLKHNIASLRLQSSD
jgi:hypothetical protein